ncbi:MAG: ribosome rescue GTPase HflX [Pseudomonadales bacterium]
MFFDRPAAGSRALLVHILQQGSELATAEELQELALSAGLEVAGCLTSGRRLPHPGTFVGAGKVEEIKTWLGANQANLIIFGDELTPTQERNLEKLLGQRVMGRTGLILEIFAQRARTHEGKLQVELAQLEHISTRLVRGWSHLDRQRGGSGRTGGGAAGLGGAGETQLEADQRMVAQQIKRVQARLAKVRRGRELNRRSRRRSEIRALSLAGYTNAGKSTLFNHLCKSSVYARDQLFATLDPTLRQLNLPSLGKAILTDTVGFIRQLPHTLVDAFRATLEEVVNADLILHVVDASAPLRQERIGEVNQVLDEIGAGDRPQLLVYNKVDLLGKKPRIEYGHDGLPQKVWLSAATGEGSGLLLDAIAQRLAPDVIETSVTLGPAQGRARSRLFELGAVLTEEPCEDGSITLGLRIQQQALDRILQRANVG